MQQFSSPAQKLMGWDAESRKTQKEQHLLHKLTVFFAQCEGLLTGEELHLCKNFNNNSENWPFYYHKLRKKQRPFYSLPKIAVVYHLLKYSRPIIKFIWKIS